MLGSSCHPCCDPPKCNTNWSQVTRITVEISSATPDYILNRNISNVKTTYFKYNQHYAGTHVLSKTSTTATTSTWNIDLATSSQSCPLSGIEFVLNNTITSTVHGQLAIYDVATRIESATFFQDTAVGCAAGWTTTRGRATLLQTRCINNQYSALNSQGETFAGHVNLGAFNLKCPDEKGCVPDTTLQLNAPSLLFISLIAFENPSLVFQYSP